MIIKIRTIKLTYVDTKLRAYSRDEYDEPSILCERRPHRGKDVDHGKRLSNEPAGLDNFFNLTVKNLLSLPTEEFSIAFHSCFLV